MAKKNDIGVERFETDFHAIPGTMFIENTTESEDETQARITTKAVDRLIGLKKPRNFTVKLTDFSKKEK